MFALILFGIGVLVSYGAAVCIYRLYLSPIARVPGPRLAAISIHYELYFDLIKHGRLPWKIADLHKKHGPIVRIGPNEVHIHDPEFVHTFFSSSSTSKRDKYAPHQHQLGVPNALISTIDTDSHRIRRNALAPFLSTPSVTSYTPLILSKVEKASIYLKKARQNGEVVELRRLFWCMTTDIITGIAFPQGMSLLDDLEVGKDWYTFHKSGQGKLLWFKHFPFLWKVLRGIPPEWLVKLVPEAASAMQWEKSNKTLAQQIIKESESRGQEPRKNTTVFHHLLQSDLPFSEKTFPRLWQEATSLVGAGVETISNTLCVTIFYLLQSPSTLATLMSELEEAIPDASLMPPLHTLTSLPYLSAVVEEGLRKSMGMVSRFMRVAPNDKIIYDKYVLPANTAISISTLLIHNDPSIFHDPEHFIPERWLDHSIDRRMMIAFGGGTRKCIGVHLAHAELYLTLAVLVRRYRLKLFKTGNIDVDARYDSLLPLPEMGSKGVRILIK